MRRTFPAGKRVVLIHKTKRKYSETMEEFYTKSAWELKRKHPDKSMVSIAKGLGIKPSTLNRWMWLRGGREGLDMRYGNK